MNRTIEIIVGTTGEIQIDAVGFRGPDCEKATRFLEEALGGLGSRSRSQNITNAAPRSVSRGSEGR
jgi:hypothetical protein